MANLFFHQWSDHDRLESRKYPYLEDVVESIQQRDPEAKELEIHLFVKEKLSKDDRTLLDVSLSAHTNIQVEVKQYQLEQDSLVKKQKQLMKVFREQIDPEDKIYIHMGQGDISTQHLIAHIGIQEYKKQILFLTGNGLEKNNYFNSLAPEAYMSNRQLYHHIHEYVMSSNYKSAKMLLEKEMSDPRISKLLQFGYDLKKLNLKESEECFDLFKEVLIENGADSSETKYVQSMKKLEDFDQKVFIAFLHNYAEHLYEENDLIDFLVLYYRLAEEMLLYAVGWDIKFPKNDRSKLIHREDTNVSLTFPKGFFVTNHYHSYLKALKRRKRKIEDKYNNKVKINRDKYTGHNLLTPRERYFADLYVFFNNKKLIDFLELRHEGVSGHGFADFSKERFEAMCGGKPPLQMLTPMLNQLGLYPNYSLFSILKKAILASLSSKIMDQEVTVRD